MMRYILYLLTAIVTYCLVMFLWGVSAGFANYVPIMAVIGAIAMFVIAAPGLIINYRAGLVLGAVCCLLMVPFSFMQAFSFFYENKNGYSLFSSMALLPAILNAITACMIVISFRKGEKISIATFSKTIAVALPVLLFIVYLVSIWKYAPWNWFVVY